MTFTEQLKALNACKESICWVGERTLEQAWLECDRIDWMLWLVAKIDLTLVVYCAAKFARTSLLYNADPRVVAAVECAEAFARGEIVSMDAADAADCAADCADRASDCADGAAYAASYAARAAGSASYAADCAAYAASYADCAASYADCAADCAAYAASYAARAVRAAGAADCADNLRIVRETISVEFIAAKLQEKS
jgi:hypothetical protein